MLQKYLPDIRQNSLHISNLQSDIASTPTNFRGGGRFSFPKPITSDQRIRLNLTSAWVRTMFCIITAQGYACDVQGRQRLQMLAYLNSFMKAEVGNFRETKEAKFWKNQTIKTTSLVRSLSKATPPKHNLIQSFHSSWHTENGVDSLTTLDNSMTVALVPPVALIGQRWRSLDQSFFCRSKCCFMSQSQTRSSQFSGVGWFKGLAPRQQKTFMIPSIIADQRLKRYLYKSFTYGIAPSKSNRKIN